MVFDRPPRRCLFLFAAVLAANVACGGDDAGPATTPGDPGSGGRGGRPGSASGGATGAGTGGGTPTSGGAGGSSLDASPSGAGGAGGQADDGSAGSGGAPGSATLDAASEVIAADSGPAPLGDFPLAAIKSARAEVYVAAATHVEGPSWRGDELFFAADGAGFGLMRVSADRKLFRYHPTLRPIGTYALATGSLLSCDHEKVLTQIFPDGKVALLAADFDPPEFCNDVTVDAPGNLYVTARRTGNLFRISPAGEIAKVVGGQDSPNGAEVDPASKYLYFGAGGSLRRVAIPASGNSFGPVETLAAAPNADGMAFDAWGNLWVTQYGAGLRIFDPARKQFIATVNTGGDATTNVTFGGTAGDTVFVTLANRGVMRVGPVPGLRGFLHPGAAQYSIKRMLDIAPANTPR